jgi:YHS domain-containing protein
MEALIYFLLWAGVIFLMMRFGCGAHVMGHGHGQHDRESTGPEARRSDMHWVPPETDIDPVCGKTVRTDQAKPSVHEGMVYYFCSRECRERFEAAPDLYVGSIRGAEPKQLDAAHG